MPLIYCPDCGKECSSEAAGCPHCGRPLVRSSLSSFRPAAPPIMEPSPKNWLVEAILVTVLCCMPFGIVALVQSSKVDTNWYAGNREAALAASASAKKWVIASLATSVGMIVLYVIFILFVHFAAIVL